MSDKELLSPDYWYCDCKKHNIKDSTLEECPECEASQKDSPNVPLTVLQYKGFSGISKIKDKCYMGISI